MTILLCLLQSILIDVADDHLATSPKELLYADLSMIFTRRDGSSHLTALFHPSPAPEAPSPITVYGGRAFGCSLAHQIGEPC